MITNDILGAVGKVQHSVTEQDLATAWRNDIPVLATPVLLWLAELAAMKALSTVIPDTLLTVGVSHTMKHLAPTPLGFKVVIEATITGITGNLVLFGIMAHDGIETILLGSHERAIVDRTRFLAKIGKKLL